MRRAAFVFAAAMLVASCGSSGGLGSLGDIILGSPSTTQPSDIRGSVDMIDTQQQRIDLNVAYVNNLRSSGSDQRGSVYYNSSTKVVYNGQNYNVTDLERGDEISVHGYNDNGRYVADTITVTRDVTS